MDLISVNHSFTHCLISPLFIYASSKNADRFSLQKWKSQMTISIPVRAFVDLLISPISDVHARKDLCGVWFSLWWGTIEFPWFENMLNPRKARICIIPVSLVSQAPSYTQLLLLVLQLSETSMWLNPKHGPCPKQWQIAWSFHWRFKVNLLARILCGFTSVKRKLLGLSLLLRQEKRAKR
jgi:hypothetical protein